MSQRFGDYKVLRRLGSGGFGSVYLAEAGDGVTVAVKVLHDHQDHVARALFVRELEAAQRVDTRHVAQVHDYDLEADPPWIAFRAAGTRTLMEAVRAGEISMRAVLQALLGAAKGLAAMHAMGLTHRDVSPDNILVTPGDGMLIDLGLATLGTGTPYSQMLAGKMAYLAPEQWTSSAVTPASDVWQWGVAATKALSGRLPFPPAGSPGEQHQLAVEEEPDLSGLDAAYDLVALCLRKNPEERPTAASLVESLLTLLSDVDRDQPFPGVLPGRAVDVLHGEAVTSVTELEVSTEGMLRVRAVVPEVANARGIVRPLRTNAGDLGVKVGDRIAIGWGADGRLHLGSVLTSLRTGKETSPELPMQCSSCGTAFEPFTSGGWRCPNEQYCPTLVEPRLDRHLALAPRMRQEPLDIDRGARRRAVMRRLVATRLVRNEGDLYAPSDDAVIARTSGLPARAVQEFLEDRRVSRERPFAATVALIPRVNDGDAWNLVRKFSTLDRLLAASIDELYEGLLDGRDASRRPASRYRPEGYTEWLREEKRRLAEEVRDWLQVPWHVEVLRRMQHCGVKMWLEPGEVWPPMRGRPARPGRRAQ